MDNSDLTGFRSFDDFMKERTKIFAATNDRSDKDIVEFNRKVLEEEYDNGVQVAEPTGIKLIDPHFKWKRGFQNVFTGYPNDGKTQFALFLMLAKALADGWKFVVWSPEMRSANFINGKVEVNYNDLYSDLTWMITGKTPYQHIAEQFKVERQTKEEFLAHCEWVHEHFIFLDPEQKTPDYIREVLERQYDAFGFDGVLIDPFKNIRQEGGMRDDLYLDMLFDSYKDFAVRHNCSHNWIAHPKANVTRIRKIEGVETLMPCDQYMLNGGAAWDNGMDGIYSVFRWGTMQDKNHPGVHFINLKQRKQALTARRGVVTGIEFDIKKYRYYFENRQFDPIARILHGDPTPKEEPKLPPYGSAQQFPKDEEKLKALEGDGSDFTITLPSSGQSELPPEKDDGDDNDLPF